MKKAKDWARQLCSVIQSAQKRPVWNFQPDHFQLIGLLLDRFRGCHLKCWSCGSQDDPMVRTRHKRWVWMLPAWNIPGLLFTTGCNVMPGVLSDGSGCRLIPNSRSVFHYQFQCNAWCTKQWVWMLPESKIPSLLFWAKYWSWFYFDGKLFLRNLCMDGEENTHSIKQSYNCWRLFFTSKIWNKGF